MILLGNQCKRLKLKNSKKHDVGSFICMSNWNAKISIKRLLILHCISPMASRIWSFKASIVSVFDGTPQIIVQRCQISSAADNAIFKNRAQNIECFGCVAHSVVLLKPNVANILLFNFCEQKFVQHGPITIAINCNGLSLLIFEEKLPNYAYGPKSALNSDWFWVRRLFNVHMCAGFLCPKCDNCACLHTRQDQKKLHLKRWFIFFCQNWHLL